MRAIPKIALPLGFMMGLLAGGAAHAQMPAWEAASYQPPVLAGPEAPRKGAALAYPRLSAGLNRVLESRDEIVAAAASGFEVANQRLQVHIETTKEAVPVLVAWLERDSAERVSSAYHLVQAHVLPGTLRALATHPDVIAVRKPYYYQPSPEEKEMRARAMAGSMVTEALSAMNVPNWHSAGIRGQGVKVGVIDAGFTNYTSYLGSDLPPTSKVFVWSPGTGNMNNSEHGLMCAEIVTDIAPGMDGLYLAAVNTEVDIVNATQWMQSQGVKVITMSLGWLSWGPGDGTGILADNINSFVSAGGFWSNSAGNSRLAHWQGNLVDADGDGWLEFDGTGREINYVMRSDLSDCQVIPAGTGISASLIWNQWNAPTTDLDFYIVKWNQATSQWDVLGKSDGEQSGQAGQKPVEEDFDVRVTDVETCYGFAIKRFSGPTNVQLEFFNRFDSSPLVVNVQEGSITPPGDTATAMAAAALNVNTFALKAYSSKGPSNGPGGALTGGYTKPDLSAFADVSCHAYGAGQCGGTSSAAPHIGGAAALVRSGYPSYTGAQTRTYLETNAVDMGPSGKDNDYGTGRLRLGAPPSSSCDTPGVPTGFSSNKTTVASGETFQLSWNAASLADSYEVQYANNPSFSSPQSSTVTGTTANASVTTATTITAYFRVRSKRTCGSMSNWSSTVTVTVTAGGGGGGYTYWIPVVANLSGSGGSKFYSDLGLLNRGGGTASVELTYYGSGGSIQGTRSESVGTNRQRILTNILGIMGKTGKGAMKVSSNQPLTVTSRTYNQATSGTFGQYYDSYVSSQALASGQSMVLAHLTQNSKYRSNIGVLNVGTGSVTVRITLYSGSTQVGSPFTMTVAAGEYKQEDRVFETKAGQTNVAEGWAKVEVTSGSGAIPMASVLDQVTSDPTTIPGKS